MTNTLSTPCFNIEEGKIVEGTLADFDSLIERSCRPNGVGYTYYITTVTREVDRDTGAVDEDGCPLAETVETEVWALAKYQFGKQTIVREFETEEEAQAAAEETYVYDILHNSEITIHLDRASAEAELAQMQDEQ